MTEPTLKIPQQSTWQPHLKLRWHFLIGAVCQCVSSSASQTWAALQCICLSVAKVIRRCAVCCDASTHCFRCPAAKCRRQKYAKLLFDGVSRLVFGILNGIPFCLLCFGGEFSSFPRRIGVDALDNGSADQAYSLARFLPTWLFAATSFKVETLLYLKNKSLILKALMGNKVLYCMNFNMLNCQEIRSRFLMCFCDHCYCPSSLATVNSCICSLRMFAV